MTRQAKYMKWHRMAGLCRTCKRDIYKGGYCRFHYASMLSRNRRLYRIHGRPDKKKKQTKERRRQLYALNKYLRTMTQLEGHNRRIDELPFTMSTTYSRPNARKRREVIPVKRRPGSGVGPLGGRTACYLTLADAR